MFERVCVVCVVCVCLCVFAWVGGWLGLWVDECEGFLKYLCRSQDKCAVSKESTYLGAKPESPQLNLLHQYHKYCGAFRRPPIKDTNRNNIQLGVRSGSIV